MQENFHVLFMIQNLHNDYETSALVRILTGN